MNDADNLPQGGDYYGQDVARQIDLVDDMLEDIKDAIAKVKDRRHEWENAEQAQDGEQMRQDLIVALSKFASFRNTDEQLSAYILLLNHLQRVNLP